jgi:ankyrin repeat protein
MSTSSSALYKAITEDRVADVKQILSDDPKHLFEEFIEYYEDTPLCIATNRKNCNIEMIKLLGKINSKAVLIQDDTGYTPVHKAIMNKQMDIIQAMIEMNNDVLDFVNRSGETFIHVAAQIGFDECITLFVKLGSTILSKHVRNSNDKYDATDGYTAMHLAVREKSKRTVETLAKLDNRLINLIHTSSYWDFDFTPLFYARSSDMVELLVRLGANFDVSIFDNEQSPNSTWLLDPDVHKTYQMLKNGICESNNSSISFTQQEVLDCRYRVYFDQSLVSRLFYFGGL